jgi:hypothetical protein
VVDAVTPNKSLDLPTTGEYVNAWGPVVNGNFTEIDTALGGVTSINVTGVVSNNYALTLSQYTPPNIEFTGTQSGNLAYFIPTGIGGIWTISNAATNTGGFTLFFFINAGNSIQLLPGRTLIVSDGAAISMADSATIAAAQAAAIATAEANANATYVKLTTTVGLMTGVTIAANPGTTPTGAPGDLFFYY